MPKSVKVKQKPFNLILLGDPGAGKATQSAYIAKRYKMFDFDMGKELTLLRQKDKKFNEVQKRTGDKGILTPTAIVREINRSIVPKVPASQGILFDGHPKMLGEAKLIKKMLDEAGRNKPLVLYLKIPTSEILKRTDHRKGYLHTKFSNRPDDTASALKNRAKYYRKNIAEVMDYFKKYYTFATIDGLGTRAEVKARFQKAISFYIKNYDKIHKSD